MMARFILEASGPSGEMYRLELSVAVFTSVFALVSRFIGP